MPITQSSIASNVISGATGPVGPTGATGITGATGSAPWVVGATSSISYTAGNVGIGSNSPSNQLYVQGTGSGFGAYDVPLSIKGTTYTLMELKGTNTIASIVYNRDGTNGWLVGFDNSGNYRIGPMTEMNQNGVSTAKDSTTTGLLIDTSSNLKFNSGYGSVATAFGVRAWVYFNTSASILGSGNVSSVSKNATGNYTVNFTNAMPNSNYSATATADIGGWQTGATQTGGYNTGSISIQSRNLSMTATDASISVVIVR